MNTPANKIILRLIKKKRGVLNEEGDFAVSMEKYGTDFRELPVTDDQIRALNQLTKAAGTTYKMPSNREEADELIEKLAMSSDG